MENCQSNVGFYISVSWNSYPAQSANTDRLLLIFEALIKQLQVLYYKSYMFPHPTQNVKWRSTDSDGWMREKECAATTTMGAKIDLRNYILLQILCSLLAF